MAKIIFFLTMLVFSNISLAEKSLSLNDQFDKNHKIEFKNISLLFASDKASGMMAKKYFLKDATKITSGKLTYIADTSGMPYLILKFIAIPRLQDLKFNVILDKDGDFFKLFPSIEKEKESNEDSLLFIVFKNGKVIKKQWINKIEKLTNI